MLSITKCLTVAIAVATVLLNNLSKKNPLDFNSWITKIPLTNVQLKAAAPSIFSESPIDGVSDRYAFVPTYSVLDTFRQAGYYPIMASESKVRNSDNQGYQKHIIQFRSIDNLLRPNVNEEYADIVLTNSHNRTSSFIVDLAFFRIVCSNMLVVPSQSFSHHSIIHAGFNHEKIKMARRL